MKMEIIILLSLVSSVFSEPTKDDEKNVFAEYYRDLVNMHEEFPNNLEVRVIFVDLNRDGKLDALATSYGSFYEDGWLWSAFTRDENGKWRPFPKVADEATDKIAQIVSIKARPDEFYRLKTNDSQSSILIIRRFYQKGENSKIHKVASRFALNDKGVLEIEKISVPNAEELGNFERLEAETIKD